ncbi:magnesium transporter [Tuwongella immobilis]|uniref:Magnesium transporter MgtE n=1 Tax=Tuwongella immobilis TaxID=692036 RepID=A0A6C2YMM1_9BACT|nr:magnesium transporter [Tuwongella immobilis]VIP02459.1 magnesium transporter : Mg2+ transport protein OS=Planctomyces maris DSM 8797 GN=PM8797T_04900 PE=4 SV=1: MgtE_N: CBS: CBS: MgtE [Tuwongella immobilis]VTS01463.1 magnesium transporter : Mg2+ transport protein OS=Planctomyces maris DSM 8797 GN=PM8797T_04900 PE=4 SV=1: MgtE_N: CBS: CBS: MgtE [Tuwongella immobilis]
MTHPFFTPELRLMLEEEDADGVRAFCETLHPALVAEALAEDFSVEEVWRVLEHTHIRDQAAIFEYFPISWQVTMVEGGGKPHMARLIEAMSHDDRVALLRRLTPRVADGLLRLVDVADRRDIAELFRYAENTVGSIMTTEYAWVPTGLTIGEAIDRLRHHAPDNETIYYVYVLQESTRRLEGVVSLRDLILSQRLVSINEVMDRDLVTLNVTDDREVAAQAIARYDFLAMPVIDDSNRLVGIVTHDDVIDIVVQEATEDLQRQGAVGPITENYLEAGFLDVWWKRTFWLSMLFIAEMLTFSATAYYEESIERIMILKYFITLCIATGGNSGTQAATLVTRAMALGQISVGHWFRVLRHELLMGIAMGLVLGIIALVRCQLVPTEMLRVEGGEDLTHIQIGWVIGQAVACICLVGTLIGAMLPMVFKKLGVDPALASSPFVATFVDVTGIVLYFSIASVYL